MGAVYELALSEWGLTPEYLNEHWTEELLLLMFKKRSERLERSVSQPVARPQMQPIGRQTAAQMYGPNGSRVKRHG